MLNFKKIMSLFLAVLMLCGGLTGLSVITVSAAEAAATEATTTAVTLPADINEEEGRTKYYFTTAKYATPEEKLATMTKMSVKGNYALYADRMSGEVAMQDLTTGQILFTNPYDIGYSNATDNVKQRLMSQIVVNFKEVESDGKKTYTSFEYAAAKDQIKIKNIKNGIRVEYTIGREEARRLVPCSIKKERFEELILAPMEEHYGLTREEAEAIRNDSTHPLYSQGFYLRKQLSYFTFKSLADATSDRLKQDMLAAFPILKEMDIYVLESTASTTEKEKIEQVIKTACPNYTYEEMDYDHQLTEYTSEEENPPLFKMALEYTIDETGINVRLPANGIRFNESMFELLDLQILPYLGAGNNAYEGYTFFPDGAGALFAFEDMLEESNETINAKIYGEDYAYHKLSDKYQQVARYPVYGIVENTRYYDYTYYDEYKEEDVTITFSGVIYDAIEKAIENKTTASDPAYKKYGNYYESGELVERTVKRGYAAFIEEGDALTSISYVHEGKQAPYDTVQMIANPRPRDEYNLADAISVGDNKNVSVVTPRKYVGNYKIHLTLLSDENLAKEAVEDGKLASDGWYEASWLGMGIAYRDYLVKKGLLTAPDSSISTTDIPLYIESFGAMETIEKILSVPVEVMRPLTSAANVNTMFEELSAQGVANINFKLTGYANGGMYATVPYNLKWEKAVSEDVSMQDLFNLASMSNGSSAEVKVSEILEITERNVEEFILSYTGLDADAFTEKFGKNTDEVSAMTLAEFLTLCQLPDGRFNVYPDFDFSYVSATKMFDGFSMRKHVVRTIDDRSAYKREYMATQQRYAGYFQLAVSPAYFDRFYKKLMEKYITYENVTGISVGTLGTALNTDFDEDEPYNREDAKSFVKTALEFISGQNNGSMEVMVNGGNAYTWQYADHIIGAAVDSSRYITASYSVPFLGVVLHGYKSFAGTPLNMEGDINYAKLKAIENGAAIYFTLSYQNTQNLKEDFQLSKYYSVRYDIWFDDVVEIYNELNSELKDVQNMPIIGHQFLSGLRVPDTDELDRDLKEEFDEVMNFQGNQQAFLDQLKTEAVADARAHIYTLTETIKSKIKNSTAFYAGGTGSAGAAAQFQSGKSSFLTTLSSYRIADAEYREIKALVAAGKADNAALTTATTALEKAKKKLTKAVSDMAKNIIKIRNTVAEIDELLQIAREGVALIESTPGCPENIVREVKQFYQDAVAASKEQIGMNFIYTSENLELQTFLDIQFSLVIDSIKGDTNYQGLDVIDRLEKQYLVIANKEYGLIKDPATYVLLRFRQENANLEASELDTKYGLKDGEASVTGLVKFIREMLGDNVTFDPTLAIAGSVDAAIQTYVENRYLQSLVDNEFKKITGDGAETVNLALQFLQINPYQHDSKFNVNNVNILNVLSQINAKINAKEGGLVSIMTELTGDASLKMEDVYDSAQMNALIDSIETILKRHLYGNEAAVNAEIKEIEARIAALDKEITDIDDAIAALDKTITECKNQISAIKKDETLTDEQKEEQIAPIQQQQKDAEAEKKAKQEEKKTVTAQKTAETTEKTACENAPKKPIEYLSNSTMREDIANYISTYYYVKVMNKLGDQIKKSGNALPAMNAKTNTMDSLPLMLNDRMETYNITDDGTGLQYAAYATAYLADLPAVRALLKQINDYLKPYGDVTENLERAYFIVFAEAMQDLKKPGKLSAGDSAESTELNEKAAALVTEEALSKLSLEDIPTLVAEIEALHGQYSAKENYDVALMSSAYAYRAYFDYVVKAQIKNVTAHPYYYDEVIATMDAAVLAKVQEKLPAINALAPADAGLMEYLDAVFTVIADPEDPTFTFTAELASKIGYSTAKKGTVEDYVTSHYLYQIFNTQRSAVIGSSVDAYPLTVKSSVTGDATNAVSENARKAIQSYLTEINSFLNDWMSIAKSSVSAGGTPNYSLEVICGKEALDKVVNDIYDYLVQREYEIDADNISRDDLNKQIRDIVKYYFYDQVFKTRLNAQKVVDFNLHEIYSNSLEDSCATLESLIEYYTTKYTDITKEELDKLFAIKTEDDKDDEDDEASRYVSDDGRIVSVTYGQAQNGGGYTPYKTFVLNYNNFSVNVVYEGVTYTIPAYGYVTVKY